MSLNITRIGTRPLRSLTACLFASLLASPVASGQSLLKAYELARENDPAFRAAQAEFRAVKTQPDQALAGYLPNVRADIEEMTSRQRILSSQNPIFGPGSTVFPTHNRTLSVTQPIFRKDLIERLLQVKSVVKQSEYLSLAAEQELISRTAAAYMVLMATSDSLALASAEREAVGKALDLARERLRAGLGTVTNEYDARARYAATQAREIEAQNRKRDAQQALREITGQLFDRPQTLREQFALETPQPAAVEHWLEASSNQNLSLRARREGVEVARKEIERQKAGYYPSLNLQLQNNRKATGSTLFGGGSNVDTTELSLRLSIPFFEGGITSAVTEEAAHRYSKAKEELEQERRSVDRSTRAYFDGVMAGVRLVDAFRQAVAAQELALKSKEVSYKSGLITLLPLLETQRDLFQARRDYAQSRYDYLVNRLRLQQAAGTLSEGDLVGISTALN